MKYTHRFIASAIACFPLFSLPAYSAQAQDSPSIIISEVRIGEADSPLNEFIELYNRSEETVDISEWKLRKKTSAGTLSSIASIETCVFLPPKKHFLWAHGKGRFAEDADKVTGTTTGFLSKSNVFEITDSDGTIQDSLAWGDIQNDNQSAERNLETLESTFVSIPTPTGHEYICQENIPEVPPSAEENTTGSQSTTIRINEVLPDPSDSEEFIELFNFGTDDIDLENWSLHDASKTGKYTFKESSIIEARSYLTLFRDTFSFALNNTNETVTLSDSRDKVIDTAAYAKSSKDASYNFSPSGWRWSGIVTPDADNQFSALPNTKASVPKNVYRDTPAQFTVQNADENKELKYLWNFGDGHTSRLTSVAHTYSKTGTYNVTLAITGAIEETIKKFTVKVKKLPKIKLSITGINPNPAGTDTGNEWISIKNDSKKKVNLLGWSIATGAIEKNIANHPFKEKMILKPNEEKVITSDISAFSLPNKGGFLEIRQPNKKVVDTLEYSMSDTVAEGAIYRRSADGSWIWTDENGTDEMHGHLEEETVPVDAQENKVQIQENITETDNIDVANSIIDTIDTLSADELMLLQAQIEAKMKVLAIEQESAFNDSDTIRPNTIADITTDSSLLAHETLVSRDPVSQNTELLHYLNRTMNSFFKKVR